MPGNTKAITFAVHEEVRDLAQTIPCSTCKAELGAPCIDRKGQSLPDGRVHPDRIVPIFVAYRAGLKQGRRQMREELTRGMEQ